MLARIKIIICLIPLLLLAGCFQQASESFEPVNSTIEPLAIPDSTDDLDTEQITPIPATPTFPPITIISQPTLSIIETAEETKNVPEDVFGDSGGTLTPGSSATTPQFITPGLPSGPVTFAPSTPTPLGGALTATPSGLVTPTAMFTADESGCTHVVAPGENLYRIALNNGLTVAEMKAANPELVGDNPVLQIGQVLQIPGCGAPSAGTSSDQPGDTGIISPEAAPTQPIVPPPGSGELYTVQPGDTLFSIATRFGTTIQAIVEANNLANPDALQVGQQLIIP